MAGVSEPLTPEFFEGAEKRVEIDFAGSGDLRRVPRAGWEEVVRLSETQILNVKETPDFLSFLLSESSLIVYPQKVVLKTCGRTVPLNSVGHALALAASVSLDPEWLCFSRKNFMLPAEQPKEHSSQDAEISRCRAACQGIGDAHILGPVTGEHWLLYDAQFLDTDCSLRTDFHVDIMMYQLEAEVRSCFFTKEVEGSAEAARTMTKSSALGEVVELMEGEVDDYCFSPCGYSCNIHAKDGSYAMVHVTPQQECSYASFETNFLSKKKGIDAARAPLNELVSKVIAVFKPAKFTVTLFTDQGGEEVIGGAPFEALDNKYGRQTCTSTHFEQDYCATVVNYTTTRNSKRLEKGRQDEEPRKRRDVIPRMLRSTSDQSLAPGAPTGSPAHGA